MAEPSVLSEIARTKTSRARTVSPVVAVSAAVLASFAMRVIPAWSAVFGASQVSFQEPDAWFHMRTIQNLMAHFPHRSGFDPYALFPGGENVTTAPFWDYFVGMISWLLGLGSPSEAITDVVGAWLPALLGAAFPIPVFFLTRRLFNSTAAMFAAVWVALIPGTFLWVSHLGMADHHAMEVLASFLVLVFLCRAVEQTGNAQWVASAAGICLAAFLSTRAAGVFVPAILAAASIISLDLALPAAVSLVVAYLVLLPAGSVSPWAQYTWLSLRTALAVTIPLSLFHRIQRERNWGGLLRDVLALTIAAASTAVVWIFERGEIRALKLVIQRHTPGQPGADAAAIVKELQPLWKSAPGGFRSVFLQFGYGWLLAAPALLIVIGIALKTRRPAMTVFAAWSSVMILGAILQLRMSAYAGFVIAVLTGASAAWIVRRVSLRAEIGGRFVTAVVLLAATASIPAGYSQTHDNGGPDSDWSAALQWLRWSTPEPMGDAAAWSRWWPSIVEEAQFRYPNSAYGVLVPWDRGWWVAGMARRIPLANGEVKGAWDTSRFLTTTDISEAREIMVRNRARYAMIAPEQITLDMRSFVTFSARDMDQYSRLYFLDTPGHGRVPIRLFLPAYFRSMGARLYLFDGRAVKASRGAQVFLSSISVNSRGETEHTIQSVKNFSSEQEAEQWINAHPMETATLASADAFASCVDLDEIPWMKRVFTSRDGPLLTGREPKAVKIFAFM